jgi:regulator of cell morphogenesis and NO signaling
MPHDIALQASALIDHIQTRYHEGHRRALPELLIMASALEARGVADGIVHALQLFGAQLEQHMFKEEMRLFPMMEQGGNTLIGQLIADLHREHVEHGDTMQSLRDCIRGLESLPDADPVLLKLAQGIHTPASELKQHIDTEDDVLFPMFQRPEPAI